MSIGGSKVRQYLNGQECFEKWVELDSTHKVAVYLADRGVVNPSTENPPTPMGVWNAALRFMITHKEYAYTYMSNAADAKYRENGDTSLAWVKNKTAFYRYLITKARMILTPDTLKVFYSDPEIVKLLTKEELSLMDDSVIGM